MTDERIANLEKEVKRLAIKLETLVDYLNAGGQFGPLHDRDRYDSLTRQALAKAGLRE
jgi:hypothetical protein